MRAQELQKGEVGNVGKSSLAVEQRCTKLDAFVSTSGVVCSQAAAHGLLELSHGHRSTSFHRQRLQPPEPSIHFYRYPVYSTHLF